MKSKKDNQYQRLELYELQSIFVMRCQGRTIQEVADHVRRGKSTVSNALNKYQHPDWRVWYRMTPLECAKFVFDEMKRNRHRTRQHGHIRDYELREYVCDRLVKDNWSPEEIAETIERYRPGKKITAKTIYNFIKHERTDLAVYLFEKGKPRRQRVTHRRGRFKQGAPKKRSIHERPEEINARQELGHFEGDTIITKRGGTKAILSLRERVTRKRIFRLIPNLEAETVLAALIAILFAIPPELRKSITFDNGTEFAYSVMIKLEAFFPGLMIYYCDSYSSWQKGSVENSNRDFRWYHPKGTDFGTLTPKDIRYVEEKTNRKPMKCNGYRSADEAFEAAMLPVAA